MSHELLVFVTTPTSDEAGRIAETLVAQRLAACVNIVGGVRSVYWWKGEVSDETEVLCLIKTTAERFATLRARLIELHPYEVPEVIALDITAGHPAYLEWLESSVTP